ncbi:NAD(P)/FAD-dependent oxidoreductase [Micromonospora sp. SL1-18]|uniref:NAD(P)/FAD-dependent oxidoreductase n=1 Tax=Micromonospora sp. SL1-18 TaxID=3399128 RepID=UPI003A4D383F
MGVVGERAVVIGGSIGGLAAAAALSRRFDLVTVLDRDELPETPRERRGIPHGMHPHALLIGGRLGLEELFPGLTEELVQGGAVPFDPGADALFVQMGAPRIRFATGMLGISLSRAYLESAIRERVRALPNVELRGRVAVSGLTGVPGRVTGVETGGGEPIAADLVVDATGHGGQSNRWLKRLALPAPEIATVKVGVGYTTLQPACGRLAYSSRSSPGDRATTATIPSPTVLQGTAVGGLRCPPTARLVSPAPGCGAGPLLSGR